MSPIQPNQNGKVEASYSYFSPPKFVPLAEATRSDILTTAGKIAFGMVVFPVGLYWVGKPLVASAYNWALNANSSFPALQSFASHFGVDSSMIEKLKNGEKVNFDALAHNVTFGDQTKMTALCNALEELGGISYTHAKNFFDSLEKANNKNNVWNIYKYDTKKMLLTSLGEASLKKHSAAISELNKQFSKTSTALSVPKFDLTKGVQTPVTLPKDPLEKLKPDATVTVSESYQQYPTVNSLTRDSVRTQTASAVNRAYQTDMHKFNGKIDPNRIPETMKSALKSTHLFSACDKSQFAMKTGREILGRKDILAIPTTMSYDENWQAFDSTKQKAFWLHNSAALNIGEPKHYIAGNSKIAEDFTDFSKLVSVQNWLSFIFGCLFSTKERRLDETAYLNEMGQDFERILSSQKALGVSDAVWFPYGMGAFLRGLPDNDSNYKNPQKMFDLRCKIAAAFFKAVEDHPGMTIHLCLPAVEAESIQNHNAFIAMLNKQSAKVKSQVKVYVNKDATQLAQDLANKKGAGKVSLTNGANRKRLGNHWADNGANIAIDENIVRRSELAATQFFALNQGYQPLTRTEDTLRDEVKRLGGKVIKLA